jgi:hypothetical protein
METSIIEQLDKSRYNLNKWFTLGWAIWFGTYIFKNAFNSKLLFGIIFITGMCGWVLAIINFIKLLKLSKIVKADSKLKEALNDELHQLYSYKSIRWGFMAVIAINGIFFSVTMFYQVSASIVCETTLYLGILTFSVAGLIYNRN